MTAIWCAVYGLIGMVTGFILTVIGRLKKRKMLAVGGILCFLCMSLPVFYLLLKLMLEICPQ